MTSIISYISVNNLYILFLYIVLILSKVDILYKEVPEIVLRISVFLLTISRLLFRMNGFSYLFQGLVSFGLLYFIYLISNGGIGGGDVKLFLIIGLVYGVINAIKILFISSWISIIYIIFIFLANKKIKGLEIPFVPFINLACILLSI